MGLVRQARYELGSELGRGAPGRVVCVLDRETGERLAGKILHASLSDDVRAAERFGREAELASSLEHPNIVDVRGTVHIDDHPVLLASPSSTAIWGECGVPACPRPGA